MSMQMPAPARAQNSDSVPSSSRLGELVISNAGACPRRIILGDIVGLALRDADTAGRLNLYECEILPDSGPPPHWHRESELFHILSGSFELSGWQDGAFRSFMAGPGDSLVIPGGTPHCFRNVGSIPAQMLALVTPGSLENFFLAAGLAYDPARQAELREEASNFERIMQAAMTYGVVPFDPAGGFGGPSVSFVPAAELETRVFAGSLLRQFARGSQCGGQFAAWSIDCLADERGVPLHAHPQAEVLRVLDGEFDLSSLVNGQPVHQQLSTGASVFIPGGAFHGFRCTSPSGGRLYLALLDASLEGFFSECSQPWDDKSAALPTSPDMEAVAQIMGIAAQHGISFPPQTV